MHGVDEAAEAFRDDTRNLVVTADGGAGFEQAVGDLARQRVPASLLGQIIEPRPERL